MKIHAERNEVYCKILRKKPTKWVVAKRANQNLTKGVSSCIPSKSLHKLGPVFKAPSVLFDLTKYHENNQPR